MKNNSCFWAYIKGNGHYRTKADYLAKKEMLKIFIRDFRIINDFEPLLNSIEYHLLLLKSRVKSWEKTIEMIDTNYCDFGEILGNISTQKLYKIYTQALDKILPKVNFLFDDYTLIIDYENKSKAIDINDLIKKYQITAQCLSKKQIEKIKSNRVLEQQNNSGLFTKPKNFILEAQLKCIDEMEDKKDAN